MAAVGFPQAGREKWTRPGHWRRSLVTARALTFDDEFDDELGEVCIQQPVIAVLGLFAFTFAGVGRFAAPQTHEEPQGREAVRLFAPCRSFRD
jgi:hypothetical protein